MPMDRASAFSYACNACGLCCRDQVVPLSPYDLLRIARAAGITTGAAVRYFTIRRGSILKFSGVNHSCVALLDSRCSLHPGRPLACRLYPLGLEHDRDGDAQRFVQLTPAAGSAGVYGAGGTVETFLAAQGVDEYLRAVARYATLLPAMRARIAALVDFDQVEPREFWRIAIREARAESGVDPNPLIDALFDPDSLGCGNGDHEPTVAAHVRALGALALGEHDAARLAAAAMMLAISLGYSPAVVSYRR
jgi:Fe-S-cluster containining protein